MRQSPALRVVKAKRPPGVFVCGKCLRKCGDRRSIWKALKSEMAKRADAAGQRAPKLVETKCMGLCPKQALVIAGGATLTLGELVIVKRAEDVPAALDLLSAEVGKPR